MVVGAAASGLVTLTQVKSALNITPTVTSDDAELQTWIAAATPVIENVCGPVASRYVTESHDGGGRILVLRQLPASEVLEVTEYVGMTPVSLDVIDTPDQATAFSVSFDASLGTLIRRYGGGIDGAFADGTDNVVVTYAAGFSVIPANIVQAAIEFVRHNFSTTQEGGNTYGSGDVDSDYPKSGSGFSIPNRMLELLQGSERIPGFA